MADWHDVVADCIHDISQCLGNKYGHKNDGILLLCDFEVGIGYDVFLNKQKIIEYQNSDKRDALAKDLLFEIKYAVPMTKQFEQLELFVVDENSRQSSSIWKISNRTGGQSPLATES